MGTGVHLGGRRPVVARVLNVPFGSYHRRLRRVLLDNARREREALGAHCDRLSGRLENVREVSACLAADDCVKFSRCLVQAFTPKK